MILYICYNVIKVITGTLLTLKSKKNVALTNCCGIKRVETQLPK